MSENHVYNPGYQILSQKVLSDSDLIYTCHISFKNEFTVPSSGSS